MCNVMTYHLGSGCLLNVKMYFYNLQLTSGIQRMHLSKCSWLSTSGQLHLRSEMAYRLIMTQWPAVAYNRLSSAWLWLAVAWRITFILWLASWLKAHWPHRRSCGGSALDGESSARRNRYGEAAMKKCNTSAKTAKWLMFGISKGGESSTSAESPRRKPIMRRPA